MMETIKSLQLERTAATTLAPPVIATGPNVPQKQLKFSPAARKPLAPRASADQKSISITPAKTFSSKENLVNVGNIHVSVSVQKPLQTVKTLQALQVSVKPLKTPSRLEEPKKSSPEKPKTPIYVSPVLSPDGGSSPFYDQELSPSQMETDPHRLSQRQKQITYGYRTLGYLRYRLLVPRDKRRKEHPRTPRKEQICSKRSWDGQVKKWRRELHKWDPAPDSGFQELLTADILESLFDGVPGISELIRGLKEKLAQGTLGEPEPEDFEEFESPNPIASPPAAKPAIVRALQF